MPRRTTISVPSELRDRFEKFEKATDSETAPEALENLLDIAAEEGYWDGESGTPVVSVERVETLEEEIEWMQKAFVELRDEVRGAE